MRCIYIKKTLILTSRDMDWQLLPQANPFLMLKLGMGDLKSLILQRNFTPNVIRIRSDAHVVL